GRLNLKLPVEVDSVNAPVVQDGLQVEVQGVRSGAREDAEVSKCRVAARGGQPRGAPRPDRRSTKDRAREGVCPVVGRDVTVVQRVTGEGGGQELRGRTTDRNVLTCWGHEAVSAGEDG